MSHNGRAIEICFAALAGQNTWQGTPLYTHSQRVVHLMKNQNPPERIGNEHVQAAWLHDVIEDSEWTLQRLFEEGFSANVLDAVEALTRRKDEPYLESYIERVALNPIAIIVKIADLVHNSDLSRLTWPISKKDLDRNRKYLAALDQLVKDRNCLWENKN